MPEVEFERKTFQELFPKEEFIEPISEKMKKVEEANEKVLSLIKEQGNYEDYSSVIVSF